MRYRINTILIVTAVTVLCLFMVSLSKPVLAQDTDQILLQLDFEDTLTGEDGEMPVDQQNTSFHDTPTGRGVMVGDEGTLQYSISENINPSEGRIEFVIQRKWDNSPISHFLLLAGDHFNGIEINKDQGQHLRFLTWSNGKEYSLSYDIRHWPADSWHTVVVKWSHTSIQMFADGELLDEENGSNIAPRSLNAPIMIGSHPSLSSSDIIFDSITIYGDPGAEPDETMTPTEAPTSLPTPTNTATSTPVETSTPTPTITSAPTPFFGPSTPRNLKAIPGANSITLEWDANEEEDLAGYFIYRAETDIGPFGVLNETAFAGTRFVDEHLPREERFCYRVTAVDADGEESLPAGPACATVGQLRAWMPDVFGKPGDLIRIPVNISNAQGVTDNGLNVEVDTRDCAAAGLIQFVTWERTGLTADYLFDSYEPEPGDVRLTTISRTGRTLAGEGHLVDLYYRVSDEIEEGSCTFGFNLQNLGVRLWSLNDQGLPERLAVDYSDTSMLTITENGQYKLGDIAPLCHDGGPDGAVDAGDVLMALAVSVGQIDPATCPFMLDAGDINGDGVINSADVVLITRISVGKPINPPQSQSQKLRYGKALAEAPGEYQVRVEQAGVKQDGEVEVAIAIDDAAGISGGDFQLNYNQFVAEPVSIEPGDLAQDFRLEKNLAKAGDGVIRFSIARPNNLSSGGGTLVKICFKAAEGAGQGAWTPLVLADVNLSRQHGEDVSWDSGINKSDGYIVVCPPYDLNRDGSEDETDLMLFGRQWGDPFTEEDLIEFKERAKD